MPSRELSPQYSITLSGLGSPSIIATSLIPESLRFSSAHWEMGFPAISINYLGPILKGRADDF